MTLAARGLAYGFSADTDIVAGVDLDLGDGEAVALIGPNGAGKTTLLRLLGGLLVPRAGTVTLGGTPIGDLTRREVARRISMVPQAQPPAFGFTALEFVLMGFHASSSRFSLDGPGQQSAARDALKAMAVDAYERRPMTQLSGGEAQRVLMARTIASNTPVWLLDEPTANLDLRHQVALLDAVRRHCDDGGSALAIVHDPNLVERWFDRVVVLSEGSILTEGDPRAVLTPEVFETAFGLRMRYLDGDGHGAWVTDLDPVDARRVEDDATSRSTA